MISLQQSLLKEYNASRHIRDKRLVCLAPFISLYFLPDGRIVPCCYNRDFVYGSYPENDVRSVWFGNRAKEFRNYIRENTLQGGCNLCAQQLEAKNFHGVHARIFDFDDTPLLSSIPAREQVTERHVAAFSAYPEILEFEISITCNLECVMCHGNHSSLIRKNRENRAPLHSPYDASFVEQLREFIPHVKIARFLGGEPFLIDVYYDIWEAFAGLNPEAEIHITTNATVFNNRVESLIHRLNVNPILSIDSFSKQTYEAIRVNARYERVQENIREFQRYCASRGKTLTIALCAMQQNRFEIPYIVQHCNDQGYNLYVNTVMWPDQSSLRFLSLQEMEYTLNAWKSVQFPRYGSYPQKGNVMQFESLINQLEAWYNSKYSTEFNPDFNGSYEAVASQMNGSITRWQKLKQFLGEKITPRKSG